MTKMILLFFAALLMMLTIDKGRERTRYTHTMEFAITKNLFYIDTLNVNFVR